MHYRLDVLPEEFNTWRLKLRRLARAGAVRISVIRQPEFVIVENKDYEPGEDEFHAVADVIQGVFDGTQVTYEEAVRSCGRQRLRLVPSSEDEGK